MIDISIIIFAAWIIFLIMAFLTKESFFFALSGVTSLIFSVMLILDSIGDPTKWMFSVFGLLLFFFGFYMIIISYKYALPGGK